MKYHYLNRGFTAGRGSQTPTPDVSRYVWERDKGICIYCGNPAAVLDHVIPWADNGPTISSNLVCSCQSCNIYRGKHPKGLKHLTRAIFWLVSHNEDIKWMDKFYPELEATLKKPARAIKRAEPIVIQQRTPKVSHKTKVIAFRLPVEIYATIERRVKGKRSHWNTISEYLRERVCYDISRSHRPKAQRIVSRPKPSYALPDSQSRKPSPQLG